MITLDNVVKHFGSHKAVDGVSLDLAEGAFCALVGPSGCGKSTTLRLINRLIEPDSGTIRVDGEDISTLDPVALRRRIGYVIQSGGLFPHWSVGRNVATVPRLLGWDEACIAARVEELLDLVGLAPTDYRDRYPHQLSGGQQQRVGVARALAADPQVLLMDEPFGALDPVTRETLQDELASIHKRTGKTIILVTHDLDEAIRLADTIVLLDEGRVLQNGSPRDILARPANALVADFVGGDRRGLRLLQAVPVRERMRPSSIVSGGLVVHRNVVAPDVTLADALAMMVARECEGLSVTDAQGKPIGTIHLTDIIGIASP